jgi:hypothetical protein
LSGRRYSAAARLFTLAPCSSPMAARNPKTASCRACRDRLARQSESQSHPLVNVISLHAWLEAEEVSARFQFQRSNQKRGDGVVE